MNLLQYLRCAMGQHQSSHHRSHIIDGRRENICRHCGRKLIREDLSWHFVNDTNASPPADSPES